MASASKTPNLNLPQWVGTEKPERTDFNEAFLAIDGYADWVSSVSVSAIGTNWAGSLTFRINRLGQVHMYGSLTVGERTATHVVLTAPSGYRPNARVVVRAYDTSSDQLIVPLLLAVSGPLSNRDPDRTSMTVSGTIEVNELYQT